MRNLFKADAALASAIDRLGTFHFATTAELNAVQILKAELSTARAALVETRARIGMLEEQVQRIANTPEAAAHVRSSRYGAMFEHALDAMLFADDDGRYIDANPAACTLLGYSQDELLQRGVIDITPEGQRPLVPQLWREFIAGGSMAGEYFVQPRSGDPIAVEFRAVANVLPGEHLSILRDVSRLRQTQHQLQAQQSARNAAALSTLYAVLDILIAARLDAQARRGWRAALTGNWGEGLEAEIDAAVAQVRRAIDTLEEAPAKVVQ